MSQELNPRDRLSPMDPLIYWKKPQTWVWIPGTCFQVCVFPTFLEILSLETSEKKRFFWHIGSIEKFEGHFDLKRGQVRLIFQSKEHYLQLALWADRNQHPCLEICRHSSFHSLEISWAEKALKQKVETKSVFSLVTQELFLERPLQILPQSTPIIWFGTNKKIDFDALSHQSCPWTWGYATLMAKRWFVETLNPQEASKVSWPFLESLGQDFNWSQKWIQDFAQGSKGLFCLDHQLLSSWQPLMRIFSKDLQPMEILQALAKAFASHWIDIDLQKSKVKISCQGGFCPPSGRLVFFQEGLSLQLLWRTFRPRTMVIQSNSNRQLQLQFDLNPKQIRLKNKKSAAALLLIQGNEIKGNLLDLELTAGADCELDRFEY